MRKRMEKTAPYLYILPMILVVGIVIIYPIIELFIGSLTSTSYDGKTIFVGLSNFKLVWPTRCSKQRSSTISSCF